VIIREGKIGLIKRGNEPAKGKWSIPGGHVELGEIVEEAVVRETKEKTGLEVENYSLIDEVNNVDLDEKGKIKYHYVIVEYFVHVKNGIDQAASDAAESIWVPFDQVADYNLTRWFRLFFKNIRERLEKASSY
jgi:ADP-ribose pyrophosphatase YjhB (NUDIX family)